MSDREISRSRRLRRIAAGGGLSMLAGLWPLLAAAAPGAQPAGGWRLGVAEVPAAPVPGAKPRTPVRIEVLAAAAVDSGAPVRAVALEQAVEQLREGELDAWVGVVPDDAAVPEGVRRSALDWSASPLAILRTDTDIHAWPALAGRTVCLSADGRYVGELSARFAAIEQVYPSATDALLALRTGQCDAAVEDEGFLRALLKYPEWRKFSAQLAPYRTGVLTQLRRPDLPEAGRQALQKALAPASLRRQAGEQAKAIAFEVYLDQTVPDCH
jgi:polar amino acid transport system substrate-binding protein